MTSSPDDAHTDARAICRRRSRRCGGCASSATATSPRLIPRRLLAGAAGGAARRAAGVVVQAARRGRCSRATGHSCGLRRIALGVSATATWFLQTVSTRVQRRFRDKVTIALESHVATLLASIATIAHQERPDYLDRLAVLRNQVFMLDHMYMSLFATCGWILRLGVTIALLVSIHPALALLARVCAPARCSPRRGGQPSSARAQERGAPGQPPGAPSVRRRRRPPPPGRKCASPASAIGSSNERRRPGSAGTGLQRARAGVRRPGTRSPGRSSAAATSARSSSCRRPRRAARATCSWRWRPARACRSTSARRSARSGSCAASGWTAATPGVAGGLRGRARRGADLPAPARLADGIRFEHVSFAYPGTDRLVLDDVT